MEGLALHALHALCRLHMSTLAIMHKELTLPIHTCFQVYINT